MNYRRFKVGTLVTSGVAAGVIAFGAPAAFAADGYVKTTDGAGQTQYVDNGDSVSVCDFSFDGHGVIGHIDVKQADGSYNSFPNVYNGKGGDTCETKIQDVVRETATIKLTACLVDGPNGTPFRCATKFISG